MVLPIWVHLVVLCQVVLPTILDHLAPMDRMEDRPILVPMVPLCTRPCPPMDHLVPMVHHMDHHTVVQWDHTATLHLWIGWIQGKSIFLTTQLDHLLTTMVNFFRFRPARRPLPMPQPDYRIHEMNKRLQQRTDDSDNLWWDAFATEFFEDDANLTLTFCLEDGPKRYSKHNHYFRF